MIDIKSLEKAFIPTRHITPIHREHPLAKGIGTVLIITAMLLTMDLLLIAIIIALVAVESLIAKTLRRVASFLWGLKTPFIFLIAVFYLMYIPEKATIYALHIVFGSIAIMNYIASTKHMDTAQALESIKIPPKVIHATELSLRLIPMTMKDAEESLEALALRGIYRGGIRGIIDALAIIIGNALTRTRYIEEALYAKFYGTQKRTYPYKLHVTLYDFLQLFIKTLILLLVILKVDLRALAIVLYSAI